MEEGIAGERTSTLVHQAAGIVAMQLDCGVIEAFDLLQLRSIEDGENIEYVALDVIDGVIRFDR